MKPRAIFSFNDPRECHCRNLSRYMYTLPCIRTSVNISCYAAYAPLMETKIVVKQRQFFDALVGTGSSELPEQDLKKIG